VPVHDTPEEAAFARDCGELAYQGEAAQLNVSTGCVGVWVRVWDNRRG
jgi:hypothetical protein